MQSLLKAVSACSVVGSKPELHCCMLLVEPSPAVLASSLQESASRRSCLRFGMPQLGVAVVPAWAAAVWLCQCARCSIGRSMLRSSAGRRRRQPRRQEAAGAAFRPRQSSREIRMPSSSASGSRPSRKASSNRSSRGACACSCPTCCRSSGASPSQALGLLCPTAGAQTPRPQVRQGQGGRYDVGDW